MRVVSNQWAGVRNSVVSFALCAVFLSVDETAQAQQAKKIPRIGWLSGTPLSGIPERTEAFRQGLRELGYIEGKNIVIEWRSYGANRDRRAALATELVRLKVDVIVAASRGATRGAKEATATIPIVMAQTDDPVADGFVASVARPGGNVTGLSTLSPEISRKRMELLKEIIPKLSRVAVFGTSTSPGNAQELKESEIAAGALGVKLQNLDILSPKDIEPAFRAAVEGRADAVLMNVTGSILIPQRKEIAALAVKSRLPAIYGRAEHAEAGGLVSYGVSLPDLDRRAAVYVDKILKGAKPADLPVEQPKKFE